jgi:hypothetical protein
MTRIIPATCMIGLAGLSLDSSLTAGTFPGLVPCLALGALTVAAGSWYRLRSAAPQRPVSTREVDILGITMALAAVALATV